ncbi:hypothetical protein WKH56_06825 [Priestia sp. SB1]|uniref:hypothetical protein n=1 Tax=Priestia sp. SB1 TaxID=3132359 RepID=UPI003182AE54
MIQTRISGLIKQLQKMKEQEGDIFVLSSFFIRNDDPDSPYEGHNVFSSPKLSLDTYVEHMREDGSVEYNYLKSENLNWNNGRNKEEKVLLLTQNEEVDVDID